MKKITYENVLKTYKSRKAGIKFLSKYKHWFPIKLCPRLAGIVGDLMGDGHLQHSPMWRMDYTSSSIEELERLNTEIKELFNISFKVRPCTTNKYDTYNLGISCNALGRVMSLCGVPHGAKVLTKFNVPKWITKDKECFRRFIKRLFDCEGGVDINSKGVEIRMWKETSLLSNGLSFFETIKINLSRHFDIKTCNVFVTGINRRKDGKETRGMTLKIKKQSEVIKFLKEIGFENKIKQEKLERIVQVIIKKKNGNDGI